MSTSKILTALLASLITAAFALTSGCASSNTAAVAAQQNLDYPLYELRTYTTHDGKLDDLHRRFRDHTRALFEKHGIKNVAYWTPTDTPNTLTYVIAHTSKDAAAKSWKAFVEDPQWRSVYAASQADGPLVSNIDSVFMRATDYSPAL